MKSRMFLMSAVLLMSALACTFGAQPPAASTNAPPEAGNPPSPSSAAESGLCANKYYPVKQGAAWTYTGTGGPEGNYAFTDTITEVRPDGFTLTSQFTGLTRTQEWVCTSEGLQALQLGSGPAANISAENMSADFQTSDVTGVVFPADLSATPQWNYGLKLSGDMTMPDNQTAHAEGTVNMMYQTAGTESVTVPAGTFNATKVQVNSTFALSASFQGISLPINFSSDSTIWIVEGIGWVKSVTNASVSGTTILSTVELQSYTIP